MAQTPEERRAKAVIAQRKYRLLHPEKAKATRLATYRKHGQKHNFKKKWGITLEERDAMISAQNCLCGICHKPFRDSKDTHIDHCHETDVIRGLLCSKCNLGIGMFHDSPAALRSAAAYLEERGK